MARPQKDATSNLHHILPWRKPPTLSSNTEVLLFYDKEAFIILRQLALYAILLTYPDK